ncbi:hypothetical protein GCM10027049_07450 [Mucilaginibacter puniceus]
MKFAKLIVVIFFLVFIHNLAYTQTLPVGTVGLEDYYRRSQLTGTADTNVSFTVRPIVPSFINPKSNPFYPDSTEKRYNLLNAESSWTAPNGKLKTEVLPITLQTQFNTHHPYGWNDGAMIPAKGLQTLMSGGIYMQYGILSVQFRPEIVIAANSDFETFNQKHYDVIFARYYDIYNNIDLPVRFGTEQYNQIYWGQSSIRLNYKSFSFGLSTENLWWGPSIRNSLLMSNNAPGFAHLTLNTRKPVKTLIGTFEGQIIGGRLENSKFPPLIPDHSFFNTNLYIPKPDNWRYLSGIIITWQPKWVPGLFLGFNQSSQSYGKNLSRLGDYFPFFSSVKKVNAPDDPVNGLDQRSSYFMRWLWPQEHAEIYFEWGRSNTTADFRQTLLAPELSRAYVFGLRKFITTNNSIDQGILIGVEAAQLQQNSIEKIKSGDGGWYVSKYIRQGYTNNGEVLGAGIGPGGNLQSLNVSWVKGIKRIGLQLERYIHNNDFYNYAFYDSGDHRRHWTDLSLAASGEWNYKNFIFNGNISAIKTLNYQWYLIQNPGDPYYVKGTDAFNLHIRTGVSYRF